MPIDSQTKSFSQLLSHVPRSFSHACNQLPTTVQVGKNEVRS